MLEYLAFLQDSKFFLGILMILMNLQGRYIVDEISDNEEEQRRNIVIRRIALFAVCFAATRDLLISLALTAGFVILAMGVSRRGQEGMENPADKEDELRRIAGLDVRVQQPAQDASTPEMFA